MWRGKKEEEEEEEEIGAGSAATVVIKKLPFFPVSAYRKRRGDRLIRNRDIL